MTRKLPWTQQGSFTKDSRQKRPAKNANPSSKRPRVDESLSGSEGPGALAPAKSQETENRARLPSTSPPPEPPSESFMADGIEDDDRYRMVEDELLTVAQKFTVHLHAAEYKRQEKMVKARNADAIKTISRPVSGRMPDHTKRKVESLVRSKTQLTALQTLLGNKTGEVGGSDDSDDGNGLPYIGTTLHVLMDSPRKKATSLSRMGPISAATRAAAGFPKSSSRSKAQDNLTNESPRSKSPLKIGQPSVFQNGSSTASSDDDDDLDAYIQAPKFKALRRKSLVSGDLLTSPPIKSTTKFFTRPRSVIPSSIQKPSSHPVSYNESPTAASNMKTEDGGILSDRVSRVASRLEQARTRKAWQDKEEKEKKRLDVIPSFL